MGNKLYNEESVKAIADGLRIKQNGSTSSFTVGEMKNGTLSLPFGNIPSYHRKEAGRVVKKLLDLKEAHPNSIVFGTISDNHVNKSNASTLTSARHAIYALESVGSLACDFVANLGDNVAGTNIDNESDYENAVYMENAIRFTMNDLEAFNLVGNHCKSNTTQKIYDLIGKYNTFDTYATTRIRGYGYKDYTDKKVRVIVLNTCDYWNIQGGNGMSYEQKDFLMKALDLSEKTNFAEWTIIILSHIPLDHLGGDYNKGSDLKAILNAYDKGSFVYITVNSSYAAAENESSKYSGTLSYNYYGKNKPKVINIHGHVHTNCYGKLTFIDDNTELDMVRVATPNSAFNQNASTDRYTAYGNYSITTAEANKIKKVANSKADTSATFYCIDLDEQVIYAVGYGADIDRTIPYKDVPVYSVTYNLTDVSSSNSSGSIIEGSSFTTTLSVGSGYALDTVTIKMGGATITSSCYDPNTGVINITNVTGDIVITATAKDNYVPHWDIKDRTAVKLNAGKDVAKDLSRHNYYWGTDGSGIFKPSVITSCTTSGNDVTFTSTQKNVGIGLPFHLEAGASYTFSAKSNVTGRVRRVTLNADGTGTDDLSYGSSGTTHSLTFTAPTDTSKWVLLVIDCYTANQSVTYTDIVLTKN